MVDSGAKVVGTALGRRLGELLAGHTSRADEELLLAALRGASAPELNDALDGALVARLFGDVDDRLFGPDHATELCDLLCRQRLDELSVQVRASVVRALQRGRTGSAAERAIRDVLVGTRGADLGALKEAIDVGVDHHDLHQLLFHDIDDDLVRREILLHFEAEAAAAPAGSLCVLSDIDDTLYANWKDQRYPKKTRYPGALAFYRALGGALCFVTARPGDRLGLVEGATLEMLRGRGVCATVLCGAFKNLPSNQRIAAGKYDNFREYQQVYPERRFVFVGDSGQGDVAFGEMLLADPSKSVRAVFIHDVVATPEARRLELAARRVHLFDTYVGAALAARALGLVDAASVRAVGEEAQSELAAIAFAEAESKAAREQELARDLAALDA